MVDSIVVEQKLENKLGAEDYSDVFPEELPRLPLDREIEFVINLLLDIALISKTSCRMAPARLKELKVQLQDLVDKVFICLRFHLRIE